MDRPNLSANPFLTLRSRYLVLGTFVMAFVLVVSLYTLLAGFNLMPAGGEDPVLTLISTLSIYTFMGGIILWECWAQGLRLNCLLGSQMGWQRSRLSIVHMVLIVASLLLFSLGISSIFLYILSLQFPGYVAQLLESNVQISATDSLYPKLYNGLMLFLLLIYAPLVEELIFRGILLQRWSTKWGLRWGLLGSSALFGLLHFNNPVGLTLFGLVMGLLYIRTRNLWVPIACHFLNNLAAVGIDRLYQATASGQTSTVADIQKTGWISVLLIGVSLPLLVRFILRSWPRGAVRIPYLMNVAELNATEPNAAEINVAEPNIAKQRDIK